MKPYFTVLHRMMVRDYNLDPDNLKDKITFDMAFKCLDSSEFYERIPKVNHTKLFSNCL